MNTFEQMFAINDKINSLMNKNKGQLKITFFDNSQVKVRVLSANTNYNFNETTYKGTLVTFTNKITDTTEYDIATIRDVE